MSWSNKSLIFSPRHIVSRPVMNLDAVFAAPSVAASEPTALIMPFDIVSLTKRFIAGDKTFDLI